MKRPDETLRKLHIHARKYGATEDVKALWSWIEQLEAENAALRDCIQYVWDISTHPKLIKGRIQLTIPDITDSKD